MDLIFSFVSLRHRSYAKGVDRQPRFPTEHSRVRVQSVTCETERRTVHYFSPMTVSFRQVFSSGRDALGSVTVPGYIETW